MGKTTLAREIAQSRQGLVLDLESPADRAKLQEPELFLSRHTDQLLILDGVQRLPGLDSADAVLGHPVAGASWEGFVIETLLTLMHPRCQAFFYRSAGGAEMDLVIEHPGGERWAIEVKRSLTPALSKGFHQARTDLAPQHCFVVIPREAAFLWPLESTLWG